MANYIHKSQYFYGNKISDYGIKHGYIDFATLAKSFDCVLANDVVKLFVADVNGEFSEYEQVNGFVDNSERIEELEERIADLEDALNLDEEETRESEELLAEIDKLSEEKEELELEQEEQHEIFQYYIISPRGAELLQELTEEIVFYLPVIDCYVWGVTHWGTSWDYVLTDIRIEMEENENG